MATDPARRVTYRNDNPVQPSQGDRIVRVVQIGGSAVPLDVSMYLSVQELEQLLVLAKSSTYRRVKLHKVGVSITQYTRVDRTEYEVWKLVCGWISPDVRG